MRLDIGLPVGRCLQGLDQQCAGPLAHEAIELFGVDHDHGLAPMHGDVLRPFPMGVTHEFTEPRLGILETPPMPDRLDG